MVRSVILGTSRGVNTSCVCNGDNILKIMHDVFHFSLGNPIPQPSSADGMGQEEVQVSVKGWLVRQDERAESYPPLLDFEGLLAKGKGRHIQGRAERPGGCPPSLLGEDAVEMPG